MPTGALPARSDDPAQDHGAAGILQRWSGAQITGIDAPSMGMTAPFT